VNAVRGISDDSECASLAIPAQIIDYTNGRINTFFDGGSDTPVKQIDFSKPYDQALRATLLAAVKLFQSNNGIQSTGNVRSQTKAKLNEPVEEGIKRVILNLERMRMLPEAMGENFVFVNVPDCTMDFYRDGKSVQNQIVVVGDPKSQTPIFKEDMTHVIFSPNWNVPMSIAREEILQYLHINPNLLIVAGVTVFHKGKKVKEPWSMEWTPDLVNSRDYTFRVRPDPKLNALGTVKFMFPNHHSVYIHDTNDTSCFKEPNRAASAGCIRAHQPVDLAVELLASKEGWTKDRIKRNMGLKNEQSVDLASPVPVYLYYLTAWVDDQGVFQNRKDIYGLDKKQIKSLTL